MAGHLPARSHVRISQRDLRGFMTEHAADFRERAAVLNQKTCSRVSQIVKTEIPQPRRLSDLSPCAIKPLAVER